VTISCWDDLRPHRGGRPQTSVVVWGSGYCPGHCPQSGLEPEEPPASIFTPRHLGLVLPGEDSHPAHERQATGHYAARVDPHRAVDDLHVVDGQPCAQDFVEREHREDLLAQIRLCQPAAPVLLRYVR